MDWHAAPPLSTADLPGTGGVVKRAPEDFVVEEVPAYPPSGSGEHLYLKVEKRDVAADQLVQHLARTLDVHPGDIGAAGMKDRRAVTRQWVSVPASAEPRLAAVADPGRIAVLESRRHENKLRTGHLRGNRFEVVVRDVVPDAAARAAAVLERLRVRGFPNYYGEQRFGRNGGTLELGLRLLRGDDRAVPRHKRSLRRLALSSAQGALFNHYVAGRLRDGVLHRVIPGEIMLVAATGGPFIAEDVEVEQPRYEARQIVPGGPMFGPKMRQARGEAAAREQALLGEAGLDLAAFGRHGKLALGTRRPVVVWPEELACEEVDGGLRLRFFLPAGCYATVLLGELTKT